MTSEEWIICAVMLFWALISLGMAHSFSKHRWRKPERSMRHKCRVTELNDKFYTVEYRYNGDKYTYTGLVSDFEKNYGYNSSYFQSKHELIKILRLYLGDKHMHERGISTYRRGLKVGRKFFVWTEEDFPSEVIRVGTDPGTADKSNARVFRTFGMCIILMIILVIAKDY